MSSTPGSFGSSTTSTDREGSLGESGATGAGSYGASGAGYEGAGTGTGTGTGTGASSGSTSAQAGSAASSSSPVEGNDILNRVVQGAHATVDRLAAAAAPHAQRLTDTVRSGQWNERADHLHEMGDEWADSLRDTVRQNPLAAVAVAVAAGLLLARLTS